MAATYKQINPVGKAPTTQPKPAPLNMHAVTDINKKRNKARQK